MRWLVIWLWWYDGVSESAMKFRIIGKVVVIAF